MKKILFVVLTVFLTLGVAACATVRNSAPEISITSATRNIRVGEAFDPLLGVTVSDANDETTDLVITHNLSEALLSNGIFVGSAGSYAYKITVTDTEGAEASVDVTLTVSANDITIVATDIIYYINHPAPDYLEGITASDLSSGNITSSLTVNDDDVDLTTVGTYELIYSATDAANNVETYTVNVIVRLDDQAPSFAGLRNFQYIIGDPALDLLQSITATDDVDGDITSSIVVNDDNVDYAVPGQYTATLTVSDLAGNEQIATVNVKVVTEASANDDEAPLISGLSDITYYIGTALPNYNLNVTSIDNVDDNITSGIVIDDSLVDLETPGVYYLTYTSVDTAGNEAVEQRKITVILDEVAPTFSGIKNFTVLLGNAAPNYLTGVTANDNVDGNLTASIVLDASAVMIGTVGVYNVTYTVSDNSGNETVRTVTVTVSSNPVLKGVEDRQSYYVGSLTYDPLRGVTATDTLDGDLTSSIQVLGSYSTSRPGKYTINITVTNSAGFTSSQSVSLTVKANPNIPTTLTSDPIELTLWHANGSTIEMALKQYALDFQVLYPNITVNIVKTGNNYDELRELTVKAIQGGTLPNLVQSYPDHVMEYIDNDALISATAYIDHPVWGYDNSATGSFVDIVPNYRRENNQYTADGEYYALPFNKSTEVVIYNKTVFDRLIAQGVIDEFPETWQDLFALSDVLKDMAPAYIDEIAALFNQSTNPQQHITADKVVIAKEKFIPFSYDSEDNAFITLIRQWGGAYTTIDAERRGVVLFDNAEARSMLNFFYDNRMNMTLPANWTTDYASDIFKLGQTFVTVGSTGGARYNTPSLIQGLGIYPFEFETAPMFYNADMPEERTAIQQGTNISLVNKGTDQERLASWLFLKYLTSYDVQLDFAKLTGYNPVRTSVLSDPTYVQFTNGFDALGNPLVGEELMKSKAARAAAMQNDFLFFDQAYVGSSAARDAVGVAFSQVMLDTTGNRAVIETALINAVTEANRVLGN